MDDARIFRGKPARPETDAARRMDRVCPAIVSHLDDALELEVGLGGRRSADVMRLVRVPDVDGAAVGVGINSRGGDAELAARPHDADCDLAAIRNQNFLE